MQAFVNISICEKLFERLLPLANHSVVGSLWADDDVLKGPSIWLHSELASVADMLASLVASRVTNNASVTNLAFVMLTEFVWRARLAITLSSPMRALIHLAPTLTDDAALATVTVPVLLELVKGTSTFAFRARKELPTLRIVRCHSRINGDEHGPVIPPTVVSSKMSLPCSHV